MQSYKGLSDKEINESRAKWGSNDLTPPARESWVKLLLGKFNDPIIKLLLFATLLSFITGYFHGTIVESLGILLAVFLATFLSFINEYKAGKEFDILNQINDTTPVKVYRNGNVTQVPKNELVGHYGKADNIVVFFKKIYYMVIKVWKFLTLFNIIFFIMKFYFGFKSPCVRAHY